MTKKHIDEPKRAEVESAARDRDSNEQADVTKAASSRRKLIQALAASGVVVSAKLIPEKWGTPVVDSVALPAHAQTTEDGPNRCTLGAINDLIRGSGQTSPASVYERIVESGLETLDTLVSQAWAGDTVPELCSPAAVCYWIRFDCNSDRGTLFIRIFTPEISQDVDEQVEDCEDISAPFQSGVPGAIGGEEFLVTIIDRNSATLRLYCSQDEIQMERNFDCPSCSELGGDTSGDGFPEDG